MVLEILLTCGYAIEVAKKAIEAKIPLFGICLGYQILGFGLRRRYTEDEVRPSLVRNHPVVDVKTMGLHH